MKILKSCNEITTADIGSYARFEGRGIINGLAGVPTKDDCYKIVDVCENELILISYRGRNKRYMTAFWYNQKAELYDEREYKKLRTRDVLRISFR